MAKSPDGRHLEQLVAFVEGALVPKGFEVKLNRKEFDQHGNAVAEFDIEVCGKLGSGHVSWLIECRDRPSDGAAPASWIEQLAGRRARFNFNKVTAVSTTGFSSSAAKFAAQSGIELRTVKSIDPKEFSWLTFEHLTIFEPVIALKSATINVTEGQSAKAMAAVAKRIRKKTFDAPIFVNSSGTKSSVWDIFVRVTTKGERDIVDKMKLETPQELKMLVAYPEADRFSVITSRGHVPIESIILTFEATMQTELVAPETFKYEDVEAGNTITEVVKFPKLVTIDKKPTALGILRIAGKPEVHVVMQSMQDAVSNSRDEV